MSAKDSRLPTVASHPDRPKGRTSPLASTRIIRSLIASSRSSPVRRVSLLLSSVFCLAIIGQSFAQLEPRSNTLRYAGQLVTLTRAAGAIFSGTVTSVHRIAATRSGEVETVQVIFHVEHAIRGTQTGQRLTIREWAGLWNAGERYRVGDRVLLFLYPPSRVGLTSPVGGLQGRFAVDKYGRVVIGNLLAGENERGAEPAGIFAERAPAKKRISFHDFAKAIRKVQEK
jgi:hypothetical protein